MRSWVIVLLVAALVVEVWAIFLIDHRVPIEAATKTNLIRELQTGSVSIGDQLAARVRAKTPAAEYALPRGPSNPKLGERVVRGTVYFHGAAAADAYLTLDPRAISEGVNPEGYAGQPTWRGRADESGHFEFSGLPKGEFVVRAWNDAAIGFARVALGESEYVGECVITLTAAAPVSGAVRDASALPISGAVVIPVPVQEQGVPEDMRLMSYLPAVTGSDGRFAFAHLPGPCRFLINGAGRGQWATAAVSPGASDVVFEWEAPGGMSGKLTREEDGRPAANVVVRLDAQTHPLMNRRAQTDAEGRYAFGGLPEGDYRVALDSDRLLLTEPGPVVHIKAGEMAQAPSLSVRRARTARGRVVDENGAGLSGMNVLARSGDRLLAVRTDQAGYYVISGLAPGDYRVCVHGAGGFAVTAEGAEVLSVAGDADLQGPNFVVRPGAGKGRVDCVVKDAFGRPVEGAALYYLAEPVNRPDGVALEKDSGSVLTDAQGRYTWDGVPRDWRFWIYASHKDELSKPFGWAQLETSAVQNVELTLNVQREGSISGSVVDALERPAAGLAVVAELTEPRPGWPQQVRSVTRQDGSFSLAGCPEGTYLVAVSRAAGNAGDPAEPLREAHVALGPTRDVSGVRLVLP